MKYFIFSFVLFGVVSGFGKDVSLLDKYKNHKDWASFPDFSKEDIPKLLEIAQSVEEMTECPRHSISSRIQEKCIVGIVALWTIEGIRQGKYPSLNPDLYDKKKKNNKTQIEILTEARTKYQKWWDNKGKGDPLKGTTLKWY